MTLLIFIGIIIVIMIIRFAKDSYRQSDKVTKEGGMREKYATIVNWMLNSHPDAKVSNETSTAIMVGVKGVSGTTIFDIVQTFGTVTIQYKVNNVVMGNHKLEWSFPEYDNQKEMIRKMENDISKYYENIMSNYQ